MSIIDEIRAFIPACPQEESDREFILDYLSEHADAFERNNETAHMTASAWVLNRDRTRVLMCYHNIYNSWSWCGGHADGCRDLLAVSMHEVEEETGLRTIPLTNGIFSLENLAVEGHMKNGVPVAPHIHMNVTYLLQAEGGELRSRPEENRDVRWMTPEEALCASSEPWMVEHVYRKLARRADAYMKAEESTG